MPNTPFQHVPTGVDRLTVQPIEENGKSVTQTRNQFRIQTIHHVQRLPHIVEDRKVQAKTKFLENLEKKGKMKNSPLTAEEHQAFCDAMSQNRKTIISNLKIGNNGFQKQIKELKDKPNSELSDLIIERFNLFVEVREKMIIALKYYRALEIRNKLNYETEALKKCIMELEEEKGKLLKEMNERKESEYSDYWIFKSGGRC